MIDSLFVNDLHVANNGRIDHIDYLSVEIRVKFHSRVDTSQLTKASFSLPGVSIANYMYPFQV